MLIARTQTLFDNVATTPLNDLDPELILYDLSTGLPVAWDQDSSDGKNAQLSFLSPDGGTYAVQVAAQSGVGEYLLETDVRQPALVADRRIFYNESRFDGDDPAAHDADDGAVAPSPAEVLAAGGDPSLGKTALLPGQHANFQNYTSYTETQLFNAGEVVPAEFVDGSLTITPEPGGLILAMLGFLVATAGRWCTERI